MGYLGSVTDQKKLEDHLIKLYVLNLTELFWLGVFVALWKTSDLPFCCYNICSKQTLIMVSQ